MAAVFSQPPPNKGVALSATGRSVLGQRKEAGKLPAALFAIVVHVGFFSLIIFGVSWQVKTPTPLNAEIWRDLPPINGRKQSTVAEIEPIKPPLIEPPAPVIDRPAKVQPAPVSKVDIALKKKKEREEKLQQELQQREELKRTEDQKKAEDAKKLKVEEAKIRAAEAKVRAEAEAREAALRNARQKAIDDYAGKVASLIRNRANIPESVTGRPVVEVKLRFLVGGSIFDAQVVKSSGNRIYDESVERAINGIRTWPQPDDLSILGGRRELNLRIEHER